MQDMARASLRIGVDSGGTFTDIALYDETTGTVAVWKVSSTPDDPSRAIADGVRQAIDELGFAGARVDYFGHGTTVATNAVIQRRGARTGLITTEGFRDVLEIGRQTRPSQFNLRTPKADVLANRADRLEVGERITYQGEVQKALDEQSVRQVAHTLRAAGVTAVAVSLINSYRNPVHEQAIKAILQREMPDAFVTISTDIAPEYREYERTATAVVNGYVGPIIRGYLERLGPRLEAAGIASLHLMQSNGGVLSFEHARQEPVRTILSGPAAGIVGATTVARLAGHPNIITFDMGGTSTDVALIEGGTPRLATETHVHGQPLLVPMLDIETVGAGGGSIAGVDSGGLLEVGPQSAGAFPGPACYEKGNAEPTVTDANVVLQVLNPKVLLGGRMAISQDAARAAVARLAERLGLDVLATAQGIVAMAVANMVRAVRVISVERGYDPREFTLVAFGGAGPVHAARLARELGIGRVLVPRTPGVLCALGLLLSDLRTSFATTRLHTLTTAAVPEIERDFAALDAKVAAWFAHEEAPSDRRQVTYSADMRYVGQGHTLNVACVRGGTPDEVVAALRGKFEQLHEQMYGFIAASEPVQITTLRAAAAVEVDKASLAPQPAATRPVATAIVGRRDVYLEVGGPAAGGFVSCPLYSRDQLGPGHAFEGPAIVEQMDATTLVLPGQRATVDPYLNLMIEG
jgi:N-methylhydantoinase A